MSHLSTINSTVFLPNSTFEQTLTKPLPKNFDEMALAMLNCSQTTGQSIYQHGRSVCDHLIQLVDHIRGLCQLSDGWRLPDWLHTYREQILSHLHEEDVLHLYTLYHDCGKPYCLSIDQETGQSHFPNHAAVSRYVWSSVGGNEVVGRLIGNDMMVHVCSAEEIDTKMRHELSVNDSVSLLLASLAEIHSNAKMFGSIDSTNFKMKWKNVERRGKQILKFWFSLAGTV